MTDEGIPTAVSRWRSKGLRILEMKHVLQLLFSGHLTLRYYNT